MSAYEAGQTGEREFDNQLVEDQVAEREAEARALLAEVYRPEGVDIWLVGAKRQFDGARPIDLLGTEREQEVFDAIERMRTGAAT